MPAQFKRADDANPGDDPELDEELVRVWMKPPRLATTVLEKCLPNGLDKGEW